MLIGLGGGAASSQGSGAGEEALDFASVQRGNPEMQRRAQEVIDGCWALGADNPIGAIHDVGAGGLSNAVPEIVEHSRCGVSLELRNVPRSLVYLRIDGEEILPLEYGRYVEGDERFEHAQVRALPTDGIDELVITVNQRAHFRVELLDPSAADSLAVLDARGVALELSVYDGDNRREGVRQPIRSGRTASIAAPDCARTLVLYRGDDEVARRVLELVPGELVQVRM